MGITVEWDDASQSMLRLTFAQLWTWDDYKFAVRQVHQMIEQQVAENAQVRLPLLVDFTQSPTLPKGALQYFSETAQNMHPNQGAIIMVSPSPFVRAIGEILIRLFPLQSRETYIADSLEEGRLMLRQRSWMRRLMRLWRARV